MTDDAELAPRIQATLATLLQDDDINVDVERHVERASTTIAVLASNRRYRYCIADEARERGGNHVIAGAIKALERRIRRDMEPTILSNSLARSPLDAMYAKPAPLDLIAAATEFLGFLPGEIEAVQVSQDLTRATYLIDVVVVGTEWAPTFEVTMEEMIADMSDRDLELMQVLIGSHELEFRQYRTALDHHIASLAARTGTPLHYLT